MLCTLGWRASATSSRWWSARTHFSSLTSFCKTRTAPASTTLGHRNKTGSRQARHHKKTGSRQARHHQKTGSRQARHHQNWLNSSSTPFTTRGQGSHKATSGSSQRKNHEDHIASKGFTSIPNIILVHQFVPMLQAMKIPGAKAATDKNGKSSRRSQHGNWRKSRVRRLFWKHKRMSFQECGVRTKITKIQRQSRAPW